MQPFWILTDTERYAGSLAAKYGTLIFKSYFKCERLQIFTDNERNRGRFAVKVPI